jgi:hypothetical protein
MGGSGIWPWLRLKNTSFDVIQERKRAGQQALIDELLAAGHGVVIFMESYNLGASVLLE